MVVTAHVNHHQNLIDVWSHRQKLMEYYTQLSIVYTENLLVQLICLNLERFIKLYHVAEMLTANSLLC